MSGRREETKLLTNERVPFNARFADYAEIETYKKLAAEWKRTNPKAQTYHVMIAEKVFTLFILSQRLYDKRLFFDGTVTTYKPAGRDWTLSAEDLDRKQKELASYGPQLERQLEAYLKLALANSVTLNIHGDARNVSALFGALDQAEREAMKAYTDNGSNRNQTENRL